MQHEAHAAHQQHEAHAHHQHETHDHHRHEAHAHHHAPAATWSVAALATLHCLTGCAIGEVLGMVVGTAFGWGNLPTMLLAIVLAFFFGYSLTLRGVLRAGVDFRTALRVALAADTLSIVVMELIDNGVILVWPSAMDATLGDALFWISLAISLVIAFAVTTPVNKWTIARGKGHAVVHRYHH
ncbi:MULTISPECIES: DUF4396 domain-containing protein [unclassified Streptomyces]|uniref:DUF4396 domain-containing protein n=1 Tax=unclassified Streptomyces TaxID=2593676 RepID=UPI0011A39D75|nr:DUF4396 domain-containing protein [Streptomyces sp. BK340]TVZ99383.1 uncharacterized protein DUF4396 [Streptomyces sp. BK340]